MSDFRVYIPRVRRQPRPRHNDTCGACSHFRRAPDDKQPGLCLVNSFGGEGAKVAKSIDDYCPRFTTKPVWP